MGGRWSAVEVEEIIGIGWASGGCFGRSVTCFLLLEVEEMIDIG